MRKLFLEANDYNLLAFVDEKNKAFAFDCESLKQAEKMDCSGAENETDIEVLAINCNGNTDDIFVFNENDWDNVTEI